MPPWSTKRLRGRTMRSSAILQAGNWVEVRSKQEILSTLNAKGELEGLPFMPEMFEFCGQRFRVFKRAHKTCDPPNGIGGRRMLHAVHLEGVRCSGQAHDGCQAKCLVFWKEAWLKKAEATAAPEALPSLPSSSEPHGQCTEQEVLAAACSRAGDGSSDEPIFRCQSTALPEATMPQRWWDLSQYVEDYTSGNVRLSQLLMSFLFCLYAALESAGLGFGTPLRWLFEAIQSMRGGSRYPRRPGQIPRGAKTPSATLDLQPGDFVKIRSYEEILATINEEGNNRGMSFDQEMVPYCGGTYRVLDRVTKIINEKTGKMQYLKSDCIMLEGVVCRARFSKNRRCCPRSIFAYWREIWLERVHPNTLPAGKPEGV